MTQIFPSCSLIKGTADFEELSALQVDVLLNLDNATRRQTFNVKIIDDDLFETTEEFCIELRLDLLRIQTSGVILSPNVSTIYILDDDSMHLVFAFTRHNQMFEIFRGIIL